jgi:hypothetical protein
MEKEEQCLELQKNNEKNLNFFIQDEVLIDFLNNSFSYDNKKFFIIKKSKHLFLRTKELAEYFNYENIHNAIKDHIDDKYKFSLEQIIKFLQIPKYIQKNEKNAIYTSLKGLYQFIDYIKKGKEKEKAKKFTEFIFTEFIPLIYYKHNYNTEPPLILNTSFVKCFHDENDIYQLYDSNVVYIMAIGFLDNELLIKYGKSRRIFEREFKDHKKTFGEQLKAIFIIETDNSDVVESLFKKTMISKGLSRKLFFAGSNRDELATTSKNFTIDDMIKTMKEIINDYPSKTKKILEMKDLEIENLKAQLKIMDMEKQLNQNNFQIEQTESKEQIEPKEQAEPKEETKPRQETKPKQEFKTKEKIKPKPKEEIKSESESDSESNSDSCSDGESNNKQKTKINKQSNIKVSLRKQKILEKFFICTNDKKDKIFNKTIDKYSELLKISKRRIYTYLKENGAITFKNDSKHGLRCVKELQNLDELEKKEEEKQNDNIQKNEIQIGLGKNIENILSQYFTYSANPKNVALNSTIDIFSINLKISKRTILQYLNKIGGTKYKCGSIQGRRNIVILKNIDNNNNNKNIL